jgi:hypothetical protein
LGRGCSKVYLVNAKVKNVFGVGGVGIFLSEC